MNKITLITWLLLTPLFITAQYDPCGNWEKFEEKGYYSVHVRSCSDSDVKEFKVSDRFYGNFEKLLSIMNNPEIIKEFNEHCTVARNLKVINSNEFIQYYFFDMPWGVTDRDVLTHIKVTQTKTMYKSVSVMYNEPLVTQPENTIRLKSVRTTFFFEKMPDGMIKMEYTGRADPNGWIPTWLVNMLAKSEAKKMVQKLKQKVQN